MQTNGVGVYSHGIGTLVRHSRLFANVGVTILDGTTYERINPSLASIGGNLSRAFLSMDDSLTKIDQSLFPDPPESVSTSAVFKERIRALVAATLDRVVPDRLKE